MRRRDESKQLPGLAGRVVSDNNTGLTSYQFPPISPQLLDSMLGCHIT